MKIISVWLALMLMAMPASAPAQPAAAPSPATFYLFVYQPGPAWRAGVPMHQQDLRDHAIYHRDLVRDGRSFAAGGYTDRDGGMAIIRATDAVAAEAMLAADPAIRNGVFVGEIRPWSPRFLAEGPLTRP